MTTTHVASLTKQELNRIETEISKGDHLHTRRYVEDAIKFHRADRDELHRRRMIIGRSAQEGDEHTDAFYCFGLLSVFCDDLKGWSLFRKQVGAAYVPSFGYLAYWFLRHYKPSNKQFLDKWLILLEEASDEGHLPSKIELKRLRAKNKGFLAVLTLLPHKLIFFFKTFFIALRNPNDERIAVPKGLNRDTKKTS